MKRLIAIPLLCAALSGCALKPVMGERCFDAAKAAGITMPGGYIIPGHTTLDERNNKIKITEWFPGSYGVIDRRSLECGYRGMGSMITITSVRHDAARDAMIDKMAEQSIERKRRYGSVSCRCTGPDCTSWSCTAY